MAATSRKRDEYSNMIEQTITQSAINTLEFEEFNVGLTMFDKVGLIINRIEYEVPDSALVEMAAASDRWTIGISADNNITSLNYSTRALIDMCELQTISTGAAAVVEHIVLPLVKDFSTLPGGGLLVAPKPLYVGLNTVNFVAVSAGTVRVYFQTLQLKAEDYFELLESRRFFG